ncbi:LptF/LptG family permease [Reinekea sp. G2M2-21]|uniref:LptF/LptG family permease n=1 Tax=Reinekea sp. G2M2-21 TaxID=2788942 RepID=UPI0018AB4211|nr:LptF/LptG family permease [Reinekea sp. G2M2-21]
MSIIQRHIFKTLFVAILVTLVAVGIIDFSLAVLSELTYEVGNNYSESLAIQYVLLNTPTRIYLYSPYIILIGVLFACGQMATHLEFVILENAGFSKTKLIRHIIVAPILWLCLFFIFGETIAPSYELKAKELKDLSVSADSNEYGVWHKENDTYYFFSAIDQSGVIQQGFYLQTLGDLSDVARKDFKKITPTAPGTWTIELSSGNGETGSNPQTAETLTWHTHLTAELLLMKNNENLNLSIQKLKQYQRYLASQGLASKNYALKLWQKYLQPLLAITLVWLGITFIFGPLRSSSMSARIFMGILVALIFNIGQQIISQLALSSDLAAWQVAMVPILLAATLATVLQMRST